jgi:hypothetical protein
MTSDALSLHVLPTLALRYGLFVKQTNSEHS